jgi:acetoin:2,6-dichlorophenolindophenol oxidoreductase subunit alpha
VAFFGDGASNCGTFHEALNLAATWRLPALFVCENNEYGLSCPREASMSIDNIADRAPGYGVPGVVVDGNDVVAVSEAVDSLLQGIRKGSGPALLECKTWRQHGHYVGDPETTRDRARCAEWLLKDPISRCGELLLSNDWASQADLDSVKAEADAEISAAVRYAEASDYPQPEELMTDVFVG